MGTRENTDAARARFPRGLDQAPGAFRFGLDALLLAAFAARHCEERRERLLSPTSRAQRLSVAELGCGCGAALLGLSLRCPEIEGLGLEREKELLHSAQVNAAALGLEQNLHFVQVDLADMRTALLRENSRDMVLANPPYGLPGQGRASASPQREAALRGPAAPQIFCRAAARLLRHHGHFFCIFEARSLSRLCAALDEAHLGLRRILPVQPRKGVAASRLLVEARKNAAPDLRLESPLTLHNAPQATPVDTPDRPGKNGACPPSLWTDQALAFCPWLAGHDPAC